MLVFQKSRRTWRDRACQACYNARVVPNVRAERSVIGLKLSYFGQAGRCDLCRNADRCSVKTSERSMALRYVNLVFLDSQLETYPFRQKVGRAKSSAANVSLQTTKLK